MKFQSYTKNIKSNISDSYRIQTKAKQNLDSQDTESDGRRLLLVVESGQNTESR